MKYLIVGNGPFLSFELINHAAKNSHIIALDGAANKMAELNIIPHLILGDFDSFEEDMIFESILKIKLADQSLTDFQKALDFVKKEATRIDVVCAMGGRIDHEQANIRALLHSYSDQCPIYLHNEYQTLEFVRDKRIHIQGKEKEACGFFGMPEASMRVLNGGLAYGGEQAFHLNLTQFSACNYLLGHEGAIVDIRGSALVVHPSFFTGKK